MMPLRNVFRPVRASRRPIMYRAGLALLVVAAIIGLQWSGMTNPLDNALRDARFRYLQRDPGDSLVVVTLDAQSLLAFGQWPLARSVYAGVIDRLHGAGARLIGFDVDFSARSSDGEDAALTQALSAAAGKVILPTFVQPANVGGGTFVENRPNAAFSDDVVYASANVFPEDSGVLRRGQTGVLLTEGYRHSLAGALAETPYGATETFYIDFGIRPKGLTVLSFKDVFDGDFDPALIAGRNVIVGATASELGDEFAVPVHGLLSGVLVHALAYESMVQDRAIHRSGAAASVGFALLALALLWQSTRCWGIRRVALPHVGVFAGLLLIPFGLQAVLPLSLDAGPALATQLLCALCSMLWEMKRRAMAIIHERERAILHLAMHDPETELPNRRALISEIRELLDNGAPQVFVVAVGIDRFDILRGAVGYRITNQLVRRMSTEFESVTHGRRVVRIATDVLGFALEGMSCDQVFQVTAAMQDIVDSSQKVGEDTIDVDITLGISQAGEHGDTPELLIERATVAMDQARDKSQKVAAFDAEAYGDPASKFTLMRNMMRALEAGHMKLFYQPKLDIGSGRICGVEGLIRWFDPDRGLIRPDVFIGMAEETGHINHLTAWVLRQAISDQLAARSVGYDIPFAINVSGREIDNPLFAARAKALLQEFDARINFEITETGVIDNPKAALRTIEEFSELGVTFSIDDYGTGLSSLSYLKKIPAKELKIDKSFVDSLLESRKDMLLIRSTVDLAHSLGMTVVAEGIESGEILLLLRQMGCDVAQGYFISKPLPFGELIQFLKQRDASDAVPAATADVASRPTYA